MARHTVERLTSKEATTRRGTRTPLLHSEERALLYVLFEQLAGSLVYLGFRAGPLLGGERAALLGEFGVAFYGGEANGEGAGCLALARPSLEGLDYLLS